MSQYLLLKKITVQNANAIAGLTYGFPAMTNFLGFVHALSRKLPESLNVSLDGVVVISHKNIIHARQPKGWGDYVFALSRNPNYLKGAELFDSKTKFLKSSSTNEEGRMNMKISLLIELHGLQAGDLATNEALLTNVEQILPTLRLAGGQIIDHDNIEVTPLNEDQKTLRKLMPGFALVDRSNYLADHFDELKKKDEQASLLDAWCDFALLKYKAEKIEPDHDENQENSTEEEKTAKAHWTYVKKPEMGYLVPINTGYCAISPVYKQGEVANVRDRNVPVVFSEAAYSVGEWKSVHGLENIESALWRYEYKHPWYVAKSTPFTQDVLEPDEFDENKIMIF